MIPIPVPADLATILRTVGAVAAAHNPDTISVTADPVSIVDGFFGSKCTIHADGAAAARQWVDALTVAGVRGWRTAADGRWVTHSADHRGWRVRVVA